MPGAQSIIGQCPECCECPEPSFRWESRSASRPKRGYGEWSGFVSDPPKRYLRFTRRSETKVEITGAAWYQLSGFLWDYSRRIYQSLDRTFYRECISEVDRDTGAVTISSDVDVGPINYYQIERYLFTDPETGITNCSHPPGNVEYPEATFFVSACESMPCGTAISSTETLSSDAPSEGPLGSGVSDRSEFCTGWPESEDFGWSKSTRIRRCIVSDEHTTAQLITETLADLAEEEYGDGGGAARHLAEDELSFLAEEGRYTVPFRVPKVGSGKRYWVRWVQRFVPDDEEEAPIDTLMCEAWDGVIPGDYDPADSDTWPKFGPFNVPVPESNGEVVLGYYTDPEDPDSFVEGGYLHGCRGDCGEDGA